MERQMRFSALACGGCERTKPADEVVWTVNFWYRDNTKRQVGYLLGSEAVVYSNMGRLRMTRSSAVCPQCAANAVAEGSLDILRIKWSDKTWTEKWINRFSRFLERVCMDGKISLENIYRGDWGDYDTLGGEGRSHV